MTASADPAKWPIGTRAPVAFSPQRPDRAEIAMPLVFWRGPAGLLAFGLALLAAAVYTAS